MLAPLNTSNDCTRSFTGTPEVAAVAAARIVDGLNDPARDLDTGTPASCT
jgi:hypothetical protein